MTKVHTHKRETRGLIPEGGLSPQNIPKHKIIQIPILLNPLNLTEKK